MQYRTKQEQPGTIYKIVIFEKSKARENSFSLIFSFELKIWENIQNNCNNMEQHKKIEFGKFWRRAVQKTSFSVSFSNFFI